MSAALAIITVTVNADLISVDDIRQETIPVVSEIRAVNGVSSCADLHHLFFCATADELDEALVQDIESN